MAFYKLSSWAFFAKGKMPNPRASEVSCLTMQTNKQMRIKKCFSFFVIFASLTSNISASRQNIKNLVGNLQDIKMSILYYSNL